MTNGKGFQLQILESVWDGWFMVHPRTLKRERELVEMKTSFKVGVRCIPFTRKGALKQGRCFQNH
jgi:hypothetical protein